MNSDENSHTIRAIQCAFRDGDEDKPCFAFEKRGPLLYIGARNFTRQPISHSPLLMSFFRPRPSGAPMKNSAGRPIDELLNCFQTKLTRLTSLIVRMSKHFETWPP